MSDLILLNLSLTPEIVEASKTACAQQAYNMLGIGLIAGMIAMLLISYTAYRLLQKKTM